jgi:hypothetical protein
VAGGTLSLAAVTYLSLREMRAQRYALARPNLRLTDVSPPV